LVIGGANVNLEDRIISKGDIITIQKYS